MTLMDRPVNPNYAATVVRVEAITELAGCDNVVGVSFFGMQAIVGKDTKVGDVGILFPTETQLSLAYVAGNNLHRHAELNADPSKTGYLEDNRRVKAMKFRGHRSDALFMPLDSLAAVGMAGWEAELLLEVGDTFDRVDGNELCRKYVIVEPRERVTAATKGKRKQERSFRRVDDKMLPEHVDTDNWWRNEHLIGRDDHIVVTQKLHGTSIRIANTIVRRRLTWLERIAQRLGVRVATTEFDAVYGSRKVIKDVNNPHHVHYYGTDLWSDVGAEYAHLIPEGFVVYGEVVGWASDSKPIQQGYTYDLRAGFRTLYVYRVAFVNAQGILVDLSWPQVQDFCHSRGIRTVPTLWQGPRRDFHVEPFMDVNYARQWGDNTPAIAHDAAVDEGIVIRVDQGWAPYFLKAKSPAFFAHETKMLDEAAPDLESEAVAEAVAA